jgi:hypothetical protein
MTGEVVLGVLFIFIIGVWLALLTPSRGRKYLTRTKSQKGYNDRRVETIDLAKADELRKRIESHNHRLLSQQLIDGLELLKAVKRLRAAKRLRLRAIKRLRAAKRLKGIPGGPQLCAGHLWSVGSTEGQTSIRCTICGELHVYKTLNHE